MDDAKKLKEIQLPPIDEIYSSLSEENITKKDYSHAINVRNEFNIKNIGE